MIKLDTTIINLVGSFMYKKPGRKPQNRVSMHVRVDPDTPKRIQEMAVSLGYVYGKGGAVGEFLDAIAAQVITLSKQGSPAHEKPQ